MLQFTPQHRLLLATTPVDFRKGIDGLAALCRKVLTHDPFSGAFFIFTNKRKTAVKILVYDGQGFWLCLKRFSKGRLAWWPTQATLSSLTAQQLTVLLYQGHPLALKLPADFRPLLLR
jgi:transposase